jgi:hypothetical protein
MLRLEFGQSQSRKWNPGLANHCSLLSSILFKEVVSILAQASKFYINIAAQAPAPVT